MRVRDLDGMTAWSLETLYARWHEYVGWCLGKGYTDVEQLLPRERLVLRAFEREFDRRGEQLTLL